MIAITNDSLRNWIAARTGGRERLAEELRVSVGTIHNWCSKAKIPERAATQLRSLMMADALPGANITVPLTAEEFAILEHACHIGGYADITDFARAAIKARARELNQDAIGSHRLNDAPALDPPRHAHTVSYRGGKKRAS